MSKLVLISLDENIDNSLNVHLQIFTEGSSQKRIAFSRGKLPPAKDVYEKYIQWQSPYSSYVLRLNPRISVEGNTASGFIDEVKAARQKFELSFNDWLQPGSQFSPIREALLENLKDPDEDIRVIFEIDNLELQRLPWHLWHYFFERYHRAEVALSIDAKTSQININKRPATILAVFGKREAIGNATRINIEKDWDVLEQLAQKHNAIHVRLEQPRLEDLYQEIDKHKPHIFFFAGHSRTENDYLSGVIELNDEQSITIDHLKPRLKQAVKWGLQLAIFNSCDGLGIARQLAKLQVPNIIVMREPVPDEVAQKFLRCFLEEFVQGKPLNRAVRRAREGITYLEHKFPGATWLPILFQNSTELPLTWQQIQGSVINDKLEQWQPASENLETKTKIQREEVTVKYSHSSSVVLPSTTVCQSCGVINLSISKFCNNCGFNFSHSPPTESPNIFGSSSTTLIPDNIPVELAPLVTSESHSEVIICPNCNHPNPEDALQCETCYTPLSEQTKQISASVNNQKLTQINEFSAISSHENKVITLQEFSNTLRGRYKITQNLGSGGFSTTFLAEDTQRPGNPVCVVKQLTLLSSDPSYLQVARRLFASEAKVLEILGTQHNQIPQLLAYFEENQEFYLVQEFVDGHDLSQEILPGKQLSENEVITLLLDILKILEFVHKNNVIHRDIKPSNLIRRHLDQRLVLIDFGAVKEISNYSVDTQTGIGSTVRIGTFGYAPPEQMAGRPSFSSDIYAVGLIAIQALTGLLPLEITPMLETQILETGELVWRKRAQISDEFADILDKMVCYNFIQRYQTTTEAIRDLERLNQEKNNSKTLNWHTRILANLIHKKKTYRNILITVFLIVTCLLTGATLLKLFPNIIKPNNLSPIPEHQNYNSK